MTLVLGLFTFFIIVCTIGLLNIYLKKNIYIEKYIVKYLIWEEQWYNYIVRLIGKVFDMT